MATRYRLKRNKTMQRGFSVLGDAAGGVVDTAKNVTGGVIKAGGDVMKSGVGKLAGAWGGAKVGAKIGSSLGILGTIGGAVAGAALAKSVGQGLHNAGNNMMQ